MILTGGRQHPFAVRKRYGRAYLLGGNAVGERLLHAIARYCTDNEVWEPRLERHEQVQDRNLQRIICISMAPQR